MVKTTEADPRITPEVLSAQDYIKKTWGHLFETQLEVALKDLFEKPENPGLAHIWRYGSADILVRSKKTEEVVAVIEIGGAHHFDKKQAANDRRKWKLCQINNVKCLNLINSLPDGLSKRKWRSLLGSHLFERKEKKWKTP